MAALGVDGSHQMGGLTVARHFLRLRAVSSASDDDLVRMAGQALTAGLQPKRSR